MHFPSIVAKLLSAPIASLVALWAKHQENEILLLGRRLKEHEMEFARSLGIQHPEKIRVRKIRPIPVPGPQWLLHCARRCGLPVFQPGGMALGYGVFMLRENEHVLRHELVHIAQYERLGGIAPFMRQYLFECLRYGYAHAPLECEACQYG